MISRRIFLSTCAAAALALAGCDKLGLPGTGTKANFNGVDITGADYRYRLPDVSGDPRGNDDFKGKVTVVFFGYTQCPDVCPTTMAELAQVKKAAPDGDRCRACSSHRPRARHARDAEGLRGSFDPGFVALRGTPEQTTAAAKAFKVFYAKVPGKTPGSYTMDHTAGSYVFDTEGRVRLFERYGAGGAQALAADVKTLLKK
jgi:protein SCO1/2